VSVEKYDTHNLMGDCGMEDEMKKSVKERIKKEVGNLVFSYCKPKVIDEKELNQTISTLTKILKDMECMADKQGIKHKECPMDNGSHYSPTDNQKIGYNAHITQFFKEWEAE